MVVYIKPKVALVGGSEVDASIPLIAPLRGDCTISALGSKASLESYFAAVDIEYRTYHLERAANTLAELSTFLKLVQEFREIQPKIVHTFDTKPGVWGRLDSHFISLSPRLRTPYLTF